MKGLSPRLRGNLGLVLIRRSCLRSIPASAGEPVDGDPVSRPQGVYPRVCGGTGHGHGSGSGDGVYPRVCGGTPGQLGGGAAGAGLSPRLRGNLQGLGLTPPGNRVYPPSAGEPITGPFRRRQLKVYPRVCGGTPSTPWRTNCSTGLSPRLRGNRLQGRRERPDHGSIPASAGEPPWPCRRSGRCRVYPRVCGGTDGGFDTRTIRVRSIPASAGEPWQASGQRGGTRVYPRVCGEPSTPRCW